MSVEPLSSGVPREPGVYAEPCVVIPKCAERWRDMRLRESADIIAETAQKDGRVIVGRVERTPWVLDRRWLDNGREVCVERCVVYARTRREALAWAEGRAK